MEPSDYCDITSQLDVREILRYLNNLGIRNISGEVLKNFITDLKKLIKYDLQLKDLDQNSRNKQSEIVGPERLHSASTVSSRIRSRGPDNQLFCNRQCVGPTTQKSDNIRIYHSAPTLGLCKTDDKPTRRACSCVHIAKKPETAKDLNKSNTININLIKVPKPPIKKKSDPVSLYHYYTSLWAKYKPNVPGENNWSDLRWSIRQKMVGNTISQTSNKISDCKENRLRKKNTE